MLCPERRFQELRHYWLCKNHPGCVHSFMWQLLRLWCLDQATTNTSPVELLNTQGLKSTLGREGRVGAYISWCFPHPLLFFSFPTPHPQSSLLGYSWRQSHYIAEPQTHRHPPASLSQALGLPCELSGRGGTAVSKPVHPIKTWSFDLFFPSNDLLAATP